MFRNFFLPLFCFFSLTLSACAEPSADLNPDHKVDPKVDIIMGADTAPNEMIAYLSPGCIHCLALAQHSLSGIKALYVDTGKLRIVFRDIPGFVPGSGGADETYLKAQDVSIALGVNMRCAYHYGDVNDFTKTFDIISYAVGKGARFDRAQNWPYYNEQAMGVVNDNLARKNLSTEEELKTCTNGPLTNEFYNVFDRNLLIFKDDLKLTSLPAYFLNGEQIDLTTGKADRVLMHALAAKINPSSEE